MSSPIIWIPNERKKIGQPRIRSCAKTGAKLKQGEMVLPIFGPLNVDQMQQYDPYVLGSVFVNQDKIMEKSHDPVWDPCNWYMLPVKMAICKREFRDNQEKDGWWLVIDCSGDIRGSPLMLSPSEL
jgi:hypothetical protein